MGCRLAARTTLIPVDTKIDAEADVKFGALNAGMALARMEDAGNDLNIVILDACRTNPFARSFRTAEQGLARMDAPKGSLIAYATAPGRVAADSGGTGRNGVYTSFLLRHMREPGQKVEEILKRVRADVVRATKDKQVPWESSSLIGDFYFVLPQVQTVQASTAPQPPAAPAPAATPVQIEKKDKTLGDFFSGLFKKQEPQPTAEAPASPDLPADGLADVPDAPAPTQAAKTVQAEPQPQTDSKANEYLALGSQASQNGKYAEAVKWFRKAAEQGEAFAQYNLGVMYADGEGVTQDYAEAVKWYRMAAEQGIAEAQFNLGNAYNSGQGVAQNYAEAVKWYSKAAEQGLAEAQFSFGYAYYSGKGVTQDYARALMWYRMAAENGLAQAQFNQGVMYLRGIHVTQNSSEAVKWFRKAAKYGFTQAQYNLGLAYNRGNGVTQDYAEAVKWYLKAAEQGYANAQFNLGLAYDLGQGVAKNFIEAVKWYLKAAEQGHSGGQTLLAVHYDNGTGVAQNYAEAVKWYRKAAEQGFAEAQHSLGVMYVKGLGVAPNIVQAYMWFSLGAAQGDPGATKSRDVAASKMTPAQVAEAQKLASQWRPKTPEELGYKPTAVADVGEEPTARGGSKVAARKKAKAKK